MIDRKILFGLGLVLLSTSYDLTQFYFNAASNEGENAKSASALPKSHSDESYEQASTIPPPKMKMSTVPTIKFVFCTS